MILLWTDFHSMIAQLLDGVRKEKERLTAAGKRVSREISSIVSNPCWHRTVSHFFILESLGIDQRAWRYTFQRLHFATACDGFLERFYLWDPFDGLLLYHFWTLSSYKSFFWSLLLASNRMETLDGFSLMVSQGQLIFMEFLDASGWFLLWDWDSFRELEIVLELSSSDFYGLFILLIHGWRWELLGVDP